MLKPPFTWLSVHRLLKRLNTISQGFVLGPQLLDRLNEYTSHPPIVNCSIVIISPGGDQLGEFFFDFLAAGFTTIDKGLTASGCFQMILAEKPD